MKTFNLAMLLALTLQPLSHAGEARFFRIIGPVPVTITDCNADGYVTWTNEVTNATFTVQMATSLGGVSNWVDYVRIPVTNGINTNRLIDPNPPSGLVWIPAGSFTMGSPTSEAGRVSDEVEHTVTLTKGFYMGKYEVTQSQYLAVVGSNPSYFTGDLNRPVEQVNWTDATNYCSLLTQADRLAGRVPSDWGYRLPTEAEWEYACRAGTTTALHFGSAIHGGMANFHSYWEYDAAIGEIYVASPVGHLDRTTTVGSYAANGFAVHDLHGNVWEWCQDWYGTYPTGTVVDPTGPNSGSDRVRRGGSWDNHGRNCRAAVRFSFNPTYWNDHVGFRVVLAPGQ